MSTAIDGWHKSRLGEIATVQKGDLITSSSVVPGPYPVVSAGLHPKLFHHRANRQGPTITVSASGANAGHVAYWADSIFASDCSTISDPSPIVSLRYLYYFMKTIQNDIFALKHGGAQPHVYPRDLSLIEIRFPTIAAQRTIAGVLQDIDAEIAALNAIRNKMSAIKQATMQHLFAGGTRLVEGKLNLPEDLP